MTTGFRRALSQAWGRRPHLWPMPLRDHSKNLKRWRVTLFTWIASRHEDVGRGAVKTKFSTVNENGWRSIPSIRSPAVISPRTIWAVESPKLCGPQTPALEASESSRRKHTPSFPSHRHIISKQSNHSNCGRTTSWYLAIQKQVSSVHFSYTDRTWNWTFVSVHSLKKTELGMIMVTEWRDPD